MSPLRRPLVGLLADEVGSSVENQLDGCRSLALARIALRTIDRVPIGRLDPAAAAAMADAVAASGLVVTMLCSTIGDQASSIADPIELDLDELQRLIDLGERLDTRVVRIMSYPNAGWSEDRWRSAVLRRFERMLALADNRNFVLAHENCSGWAATDPGRVADLFKTFARSPLRAVFDVGNPLFHRADGAAYLDQVIGQVVEVHLKDLDPDLTTVPPGTGVVDVRGYVAALAAQGFVGPYTLEPHLRLPHGPAPADPRGDDVAVLRRHLEAAEDLLVAVAAAPDSSLAVPRPERHGA